MSVHECPICVETYTDVKQPKMLPCGHSLCSQCASKLAADSSDCPTCQSHLFLSEWSILSDSYAVMEVPAKAALCATGENKPAQVFSDLKSQENQIKQRISDLQRDIQHIRQQKTLLPEDLPVRDPPLPPQIHVSDEENPCKLDESQISSQILTEILSKCSLISQDTLEIPEKPDFSHESDFDVPSEYSQNPLLTRISVLQNESNLAQKRLRNYFAALSQLKNLQFRLQSDHNTLQTEFQRNQTLCQNQQKSLQEALKSTLDSKITLENHIKTVESESKTLKNQLKALDFEKNKVIKDLEAKYATEILDLNTELQSLESKSKLFLYSNLLENRKKEMKMWLETVKKTAESEKKEVEEVKMRIEVLKKRVEEGKMEEIGDLEGKMTDLKEEIGKVMREIEEMKREKEEICDKIKENKAKKDEIVEDVRKSKQTQEKMQREVAILVGKTSKLQGEIEKFQAKVDKIHEKSAALGRDYESKVDKQRSLDADMAVVSRYRENVLQPWAAKLSTRLQALPPCSLPDLAPPTPPSPVSLPIKPPAVVPVTPYLEMRNRRQKEKDWVTEACLLTRKQLERKRTVVEELRHKGRTGEKHTGRRQGLAVIGAVFSFVVMFLW